MKKIRLITLATACMFALLPCLCMAQNKIVRRAPAKKASTTHKATPRKTSNGPITPAEKKNILRTLVNNMVYVEGGTFTLGAIVKNEFNTFFSSPEHQVSLESFRIGKYEVTQREWRAVMGSNPSKYKDDSQPVENVSWEDCQRFIAKLNNLVGQTFRLPTEAEWEYAARGGNKSQDYKYAGSNDLDLVAWHLENSNNRPHRVGTKRPNELGLYDMSGNVWEWCHDWYETYKPEAQHNPTGPSSGSVRVFRGGDRVSTPNCCRVVYRFSDSPSRHDEYIGLRLAL